MNDHKLRTIFTGELASEMVMCALPKGAPVLDFYVRVESPTGEWFTVQASIYGDRAENYVNLQRGDTVHIEGYISKPRLIRRGGVVTPTFNISVLEIFKEVP